VNYFRLLLPKVVKKYFLRLHCISFKITICEFLIAHFRFFHIGAFRLFLVIFYRFTLMFIMLKFARFRNFLIV
jgi:hypothetical protein